MDSITNETNRGSPSSDLGHADTDPGVPTQVVHNLSGLAASAPEQVLVYRNLRLRRIMDPTPLLLHEAATLGETARALSRAGGDIAVFVNRQRQLVGLASAADLLHTLLNVGIVEWDRTLAINIAMLAPPVLSVSARVDEARDLMTHLRCPAAVVVDSEQRVVGLVRARELLCGLETAHLAERDLGD